MKSKIHESNYDNKKVMSKKPKTFRYKRVKKYDYEWISTDGDGGGYFKVTGDGEFLTGCANRDELDKYLYDRKHTVILHTKRIDSYFEGVIRKGYFPLDGDKYHVANVSGSGGRVPMLDILEFKADTEGKLLFMLHQFKRKHNLIFERL